MKKRKVIFIAPLPPPFGGIANWTRILLSYIGREKKGEIQYEIIDSSPKKRVTEGRGILSRIVCSGFAMIKMIKALKKILKSDFYDVIHITTSGSLALIRDRFLIKTAKKKKVKIIYHIHFGRIPDIFEKKGMEFRLLCYNLKHCSEIIVIDRKTEKTLRQNGYAEKIHYIPNGVDWKDFPEKSKKRKNIINFAGWIIKEKGIEELVSAWKQIDQKLKKDWTLRLIGPYQQEFRKKLDAEAIENLIFTGEKSHEETLTLINEGKVFVLPSYSEGFPFSILEAMVLEQKIIATDVGDMKEMLSPDCGYIIRSRDVEELRNVLSRILREEDFEMALRAGKKAKEQYYISEIYKKYETLYR